jgi:hypothetical protein
VLPSGVLPNYHLFVASSCDDYHCPGAICSCACRVCLALLEMAAFHVLRINIKFCFTLGKTFTETCEMMKSIYGDQCMSCTRCYEWFKRFKDSQPSTHDEPCLGQPSVSCDDAHVAVVHEIMRSNHHLTVQEIVEECNISIISCHDILMTKLEIRRGSFKVYPTTSDTGSERQLRCHLSGSFGS